MAEQRPGPWRGQYGVPPPPPADTAAYPTTAGWPGSWWSRLAPGPRVALIIAAFVVPLVMLCGMVTVLAAVTGDPGSPAAAPSPTASPTPSPSPSPTVEVRRVTETEEIPFEEIIEEDSSLPAGSEQVRSEGANGEKVVIYEETYVDGRRTGRTKVGEEITQEPEDRVVVRGTGQPPPPPPPPPPAPPRGGSGDDGDESGQAGCHPSYQGACVPFASDVDCEGGGGDGPAYVRGPVLIVGPDVYGLDRDGDGVACER